MDFQNLPDRKSVFAGKEGPAWPRKHPTALEKIKHRDRLLTGVTVDGNFRIVFIKALEMVETAAERHGLNPLSTTLLGDLLMGSALCNALFLKHETIALKMRCEGPAGFLAAEATNTGEVRGYIENRDCTGSGANRADMIAAAIGGGIFQVNKFRDGGQSTNSFSELKYGNISKDLANYFLQSEQIPTAVRLETRLDENLRPASAYGFIVQALPGASEEQVARMEESVLELRSFTELEEEAENTSTLFLNLFEHHPLTVSARRAVDFYCRCSHESFALRLTGLGAEELHSMAADGDQEIVCHYCNSRYVFTPEELLKMAG